MSYYSLFPYESTHVFYFLAGASVIQVEATDNDDPREGQNARLTYSLEKNVIDESSGSPILTIHTRTGLITTALCCLDREKTHQYEIQVVATDGGGLKGECLVMFSLISDVFTTLFTHHCKITCVKVHIIYRMVSFTSCYSGIYDTYFSL